MEVLSKDGAVTSEDSVVVDGNITTSRGLGTAVDFALSLISQLENEEKAKEIVEQHLVRGQVVDKYLLHMDENM